MSAKDNAIVTKFLDGDFKDYLAKGLANEEIKEKIRDYTKVCQLKEKVAKELLSLFKKEDKNSGYMDDLAADLKRLAETTKDSKEEPENGEV